MRGTYDITYIQGPIRVEKDIFGPISSMRLLFMKVLILLILKYQNFEIPYGNTWAHIGPVYLSCIFKSVDTTPFPYRT